MTTNNIVALRPYVQHETAMRELRMLKRRAVVQELMLVAIIAVQIINLITALRR
jgi:hypothetical protein